MRTLLLTLFCLVSVILPRPLSACSVCFVAKQENLMAFFATGVLLSLLPFILIGGLAFWLYRQAKGQRESLTTEEQGLQETAKRFG